MNATCPRGARAPCRAASSGPLRTVASKGDVTLEIANVHYSELELMMGNKHLCAF